MASRNKNERAHVNALVKAIQKNSPGVYVYIDRDAGNARHTSSGWDFMLAQNGRVAYCEAKIESKKLSDFQEFTRAFILTSGTPYLIVRFWNEGKFFTVDDKKRIAVSDAEIHDFIPYNTAALKYYGAFARLNHI